MGEIRQKTIVVLGAFGAAAWILEASGYREYLGASWGDTLSMVPAEIALVLGIMVGAALLFDI